MPRPARIDRAAPGKAGARGALSLLSSYAALTAILLAFLTQTATSAADTPAGLSFELRRSPALTNAPASGRLFVILARTNSPEPRLILGRAGAGAPDAFARDVAALTPGAVSVLSDGNVFGYPITEIKSLPAGDYFVQALFTANQDLNLTTAPGNLYSDVQKTHLAPAGPAVLRLELSHELPPEEVPPDTEEVRFVRIQSQLLTRFHHRPIFLRAGVILPRDHARDTSRRYPVWVRIGGLNARYTVVSRLMAADSDFRRTWQADETPRFILLQLDGVGPFGDPYYVNSANNGPYGDALVTELLPQIERTFRAIGKPHARVLSGVSTGGWVALALQLFYPEVFNGAWSFCPDPVDFRALELVDIYHDRNMYVNRYGNERPSERDAKGDTVLTMRREVGAENLLGRDNSYSFSGQQWCAWNAVFGPRGKDGSPALLWDPRTGEIDAAVAAQWRKYDLRLFLEENWPRLGPKLAGKLHIAASESDQFFLNNAVHLLEESLAHAQPPFRGTIVYGPRKPHGWTDVDLPAMLREMDAAVRR